MTTTSDKLLAYAKEEAKKNEMTSEEMETFKKCCVDVFSTHEGKIVAKAMMKTCGIYKFPDTNFDPCQSAFQKGMIHIYKLFIKGQLDAKTIMEIETGRE